MYSMYKFNQAGTPPTPIPDLCTYFDIGKMKIHELLRGGKYKYRKEEEAEKKPLKRIKPEPVERLPPKKTKKTKEKTKATPTT